MNEPRNLLKGWCPVGQSFPDALRALDPEYGRRLNEELNSWKGDKSGELQSAWVLAAHTGHWPSQRDSATAGNGLVDFTLTSDGAPLEIAEVMATSDPRYIADSVHLRSRVAVAVAAAYGGTNAWGLTFDERSAMPSGRANTDAAAKEIGTALDDCDSRGERRTDNLGWGASGYVLEDGHLPGVYLKGWFGGVPAGDGRNYLDRLSNYLADDITIVRHVEKLVREGESLGAERRHLYLHMDALGEHGGLFASSPSFFTWGTFTPPAGITDLWLDTTGFDVYRWTAEAGWVFHPGSDRTAENARAHVAGPNS